MLCLCLLAGTVFADDPQPSECDHDYTLVAYEAPRYRAPGFEHYRGTKYGDEYEIELPQLVELELRFPEQRDLRPPDDLRRLLRNVLHAEDHPLPAGHSRFAKEGTLQEKLDELFG